MTQELDYIIISYLYRNAQNTKTWPDYPMAFANPNGYPIEGVLAKLEKLGLYSGISIIFQHTFEGLIKYTKLTNEDYDSYDFSDDGDEHPFTQVFDIGSPETILDGYGIDVQTLVTQYTSEHNEPIPTIDQLFEKLEKDGVDEA